LLKGAAALETRQSALWCADNQLVTVFLSQYAPPMAETQHPCAQLGRSYAVVQVISPTPNPLFRRIELSVYAATAGETVSADSKAERLAFLATVIPQDAGAP
jgi:general secretion pathway protein I